MLPCIQATKINYHEEKPFSWSFFQYLSEGAEADPDRLIEYVLFYIKVTRKPFFWSSFQYLSEGVETDLLKKSEPLRKETYV